MSVHTVRFVPQTVDGYSNVDECNTQHTVSAVGEDGRVQEEFEKQKIGHRRVDKQGEVSYKRVPTNALMGAIQMGIANAVGSLASVPMRDILITDFYMVETLPFPSNGSQLTPAHNFGDFRFQTFAPIAFRYFRKLFNIETADFLHSICFEPLQELSNPGASGSIFYVTSDERFIIKTVQHNEADFLQSLLPSYFMNLKQNALTLLPKFFGFFCYQRLGKNIRLIVMNNLLPQSVMMHEKYDLKGSTYKRYASKSERAKPSPTLKDLDFAKKHPEGFYLEVDKYESLMKTLERDCLVLQSCKIMDYSLLVGVHRIEPGDGSWNDVYDNEVEDDKAANNAGGITPSTDDICKRRRSRFWDLDSNISPGVYPARNYKGQSIILFLGVIDILQKYRFFKKFEHTWKSLLYKADSVSVHNPSFYANRFLKFMRNNVFHCYSPCNSILQKSKVLLRLNGDKEKEELPGNNSAMPHTVQINVLPTNKIIGRRRCFGQEPVIEKKEKKKVGRLFAPEPDRFLYDQEQGSGRKITCLSREEITVSTQEIIPAISCSTLTDGQQLADEEINRRRKSASESEVVHMTRHVESVSNHTVMGNFVTRIYISP